MHLKCQKKHSDTVKLKQLVYLYIEENIVITMLVNLNEFIENNPKELLSYLLEEPSFLTDHIITDCTNNKPSSYVDHCLSTIKKIEPALIEKAKECKSADDANEIRSFLTQLSNLFFVQKSITNPPSNQYEKLKIKKNKLEHFGKQVFSELENDQTKIDKIADFYKKIYDAVPEKHQVTVMTSLNPEKEPGPLDLLSLNLVSVSTGLRVEDLEKIKETFLDQFMGLKEAKSFNIETQNSQSSKTDHNTRNFSQKSSTLLQNSAAIFTWLHFDEAVIPENHIIKIGQDRRIINYIDRLKEEAQERKKYDLPPVIFIYRSTFVTTDAQKSQIEKLKNLDEHLFIVDYDSLEKINDEEEANKNCESWYQTPMLKHFSRENIHYYQNDYLKSVNMEKELSYEPHMMRFFDYEINDQDNYLKFREHLRATSIKGMTIDLFKLECLYNISALLKHCKLQNPSAFNQVSHGLVQDFDLKLELQKFKEHDKGLLNPDYNSDDQIVCYPDSRCPESFILNPVATERRNNFIMKSFKRFMSINLTELGQDKSDSLCNTMNINPLQEIALKLSENYAQSITGNTLIEDLIDDARSKIMEINPKECSLNKLWEEKVAEPKLLFNPTQLLFSNYSGSEYMLDTQHCVFMNQKFIKSNTADNSWKVSFETNDNLPPKTTLTHPNIQSLNLNSNIIKN